MKCPNCGSAVAVIADPVIVTIDTEPFVNTDFGCNACKEEGTAHFTFDKITLYDE